MKVELVFPKDLTKEDIRWLILSAMKGWDGVTAQDIVNAAKQGTVGIYRLSGEVRGIFALEPQGQDMKIVALAGKGFLRHFQEIHSAILGLARAHGCLRVTGLVSRPGLLALYKKHTAARVAASVIVEDLT